MFGAGTSECIRDTQIIGTGRNRRGRFEGMSDSAVETAERLLACGYIGQNYLEDLPKHRISAIAKELGENEAAVKDAFARIRTLNPKPGSIFGEGTTVLYVIPDIIVSEEHGEYTAALNEDVYRKLRLNESYVKLEGF